MGIWHRQQPGDKAGNSWRTNGHLWLWKLFLGNNKSNKLGKTWPRAGKCDGCQQKIGLIIRRKKSKPTKLQGLWIMRGNICIYLDKNIMQQSFWIVGNIFKSIYTVCWVLLGDGQGTSWVGRLLGGHSSSKDLALFAWEAVMESDKLHSFTLVNLTAPGFLAVLFLPVLLG